MSIEFGHEPNPYGTQKAGSGADPYGTQKTGANHTPHPYRNTQKPNVNTAPTNGNNNTSYGNYSDNHSRSFSRKKLLIAVICALAGVVLLLLIGYFTIHNWSTASCTEPSVCSICGKQRQAATGHEWVEATCTDAKYCSVCLAENGLPLGHDWSVATCSAASTCTRCGAGNGESLPHSWLKATYAMPQTCSVCGSTQGDPVPIPNISLAQEIKRSSDIYYDTMELYNEEELYRERVPNGPSYYYDEYNDLRMIVNAKGNSGIGEYSDLYRRYYYYNGSELVFAIFEGEDIHRLYFNDGYLMRWRYQAPGQARSDAVNEDFTASEGFLLWERLALEESASLMHSAYGY